MKTHTQATKLVIDLLNEEFTGQRKIELRDEGQGETWSGILSWEFANDITLDIELNVTWETELSEGSYDTPADASTYNEEIEFVSVGLMQDHEDIAIDFVLGNITEKLAKKLTSKIDLI